MKKLVLILILLIAAAGLISLMAWYQRASFLAEVMHRHLGVPVSIQSLEVTRRSATISNLIIGNPRRFATPMAFSARSIDMTAELSKFLDNPLIIDEIVMDDLWINLETQKAGKTNWDIILAQQGGKPSKGRHYLIKTLILRNLTVQAIDANGNRKTYPTLARMEFHNISDETGFPVSEIEKAIFNLMMQDLFKKLNLEKVFQSIPGGQNIPSGIFQQLFK